MSEKVLNAARAAELWEAVKDRSLPVKAMTQAEYEALSEEEKAKDILYITPGEGAESTLAGNVYSAEETRIGTWIDGNPLYRKVLELTIPNTANIDETIYTFDGIDIKKMQGYVGYIPDKLTTGYANLPFVYDSDHATIWIYNNKLFFRRTSITLFQNGTITLIIEYTKATS